MAILDGILGSAATVRDLFASALGRARGTRSDDERSAGEPATGGWPVGVGFVTGAAAVLAAIVLLIVLVVGTPEHPTPLNVAPPAEVGVGSTAGPGTPGSEASPNTAWTGPGAEGVPAAELPPRPGSPTAPGSGSASASPSAATLPLTARYTIESSSLVGYRVKVTIANPNPDPVDRWVVTITLPRSPLTVSDVVGAESRQDGSTWTFVPSASAKPAPAGKSVSFRFRVDGVGVNSAPTACTINGRPCATS